ncbi:beta strand repeat-containing protein, partial [Sandarakinorhabdus sp.]|uniref:beta strand repeat-containing protein n=1 Tax=Sandarakinorhabdus sp. TaxID=1916663 RepID=UPI0038F69C59
MRACHSRSSASTAVLAALIAVQPLTGAAALAQAFQGNATTILGGASRFFGPAGTETIVIDGAQATINWTPSDSGGGGAPINFLPAGNTADFISAQQGAFTVLNRIIAADPSRVIALNGAVTATPGGNVWFYAPGGLLIGATASFNVGGLLLTANDPVGAAQGLPFLTGSAQNQFGLAAAPGSTAGVTVAAGAQIRAATDGSYFLAVAPRISFAGSAVVNGSAALVQAEAVDFTLNGGLFDITATIGSDVSAMTVGGSITGPAAKAAGDARRIYLMAVPKNNAITLLLTAGAGDIGFDIAGAADVVGNTIVLSAGHNIQSGAGDDVFGARVGTGTASIIVSGRNVTSRLIGRAATDAIVTADTGNASFAADVTLFAGGEASINAQAGRTVTIGGNVLLDASASGASGDASGRTAAVRASGGGSIEVSGDVSALANGFGSGFQGQGAAGDGKGGTALLSLASGGSLTARNLVLEARGLGGAGFSGADGGRGDGGTARIDVSGGILGLAGNAQLTAVGVGGLSDGGRAGDGQGKLAEIVGDAGADINVNGAIEVFADGSSEDVDAQAAFKSGDGSGGTAQVRIGTSSKLAVGGNLEIAAKGDGNRGAGG